METCITCSICCILFSISSSVWQAGVIVLNFRTPFSRSTFVGYVANMGMELLFILHVLCAHALVICMFITFNLYIQTFCTDFSTLFDRIDDSLKSSASDNAGVKTLSANAIEFLMRIDE